jgi:GT2 family glycosyltransferase
MHRRTSLGILPSISDDLSVYLDFIKLMEAQTRRVDLLVVGYQGDDESLAYLRENLLEREFGIKVEIIKINDKSLARAKNILIDMYKDGHDYIFIYEDDVVYDKDYNAHMVEELNRNGADMISSIEKTERTLRTVLYALLYTIFHIYPLNDMRSLLTIMPFGTTMKSRYLSGGFSMVRREVFDDFKYDDRLILYSLGEDIDFSYRVASKYKAIVTNKIRCIHNSKKVRKFDSPIMINAKINFWAYFFNKNINRNIYLPQYLLLLLANIVEAAMLSLKNFDIAILKEVYRTIKLNREGIYTSPFIDGSLALDHANAADRG